jgi:hypothetical protein
MGFPDSFKIHPNKGEAYRQIGNSVCIPMIKEIGKQIKQQLLTNRNEPADTNAIFRDTLFRHDGSSWV